MEREAYLYKRLGKGKVACLTCQRRCIISEGKTGWCHTRVNKGGKLYTQIYGEVSSLSINPIEKKPVFHFYPGSRWLSIGSVGCNFRCPGCQLDLVIFVSYTDQHKTHRFLLESYNEEESSQLLDFRKTLRPPI